MAIGLRRIFAGRNKQNLRLSGLCCFVLLLQTACRHTPLPPTEESLKEEKQDTSFLEQPSAPVLKTGLFISDGGVHTFSALAVLDFFQENNFSFDFVAGSGWGAWIAAFYAKNHNTSELKWNLFKLQQNKLFAKTGFFNTKNQPDILAENIKQIFTSSLQTSFACPALNQKGQREWFREYQPRTALLNCLNLLPPRFFKFKNNSYKAHLFSAVSAIEYLKAQGMELIIWIRPEIPLKGLALKEHYAVAFWQELALNLNQIKPDSRTFIISIPVFSYSINDFSKLGMIIKNPLPFSVKRQIIHLEKFLKQYEEKKAKEMLDKKSLEETSALDLTTQKDK